MKRNPYSKLLLMLFVSIPGVSAAQSACDGDPTSPTTVVVSPGSTEQASGTALVSALNSAVATSSRPCLVKVEPGVYDLGSSRLQMKSWVDVEGSGIGATIVQGDGPTGASDGVVLGADNSEIRDLSITCPSTAVGCTGFVNPGSSSNLINVEIYASVSTGDMIGILNEGGSPLIKDTNISLSDGDGNVFGMLNVDNSSASPFTYAMPRIENSSVDVRRVNSQKVAAGLVFEETSRLQYMRNTQIVVLNGASATGILARNYAPISSGPTVLRIQGSRMTVRDGINSNTAIDLGTHNLGLEIIRSIIKALGSTGIAINSDKQSGAEITIENSRIIAEGTVASIIGDTVDVAISKVCGAGIDATTEICNLVVDCDPATPSSLNNCP